MRIEVELKFRAETEEPLDTLATLRELGAAVLGGTRSFDEEDRYLDTADGRLAAARWACRLRKRGASLIASLKGPPEAPPRGGALHRRPEVEGPATAGLDPAAWPASPARDLLLRLAGGAALSETLRLWQRRTERRVSASGAAIGTLSLDRVRIERDGRRLGRLFTVELELDADEPSRTAGLADSLAAIPGLRADPHTKLEHALALLDAAER